MSTTAWTDSLPPLSMEPSVTVQYCGWHHSPSPYSAWQVQAGRQASARPEPTCSTWPALDSVKGRYDPLDAALFTQLPRERERGNNRKVKGCKLGSTGSQLHSVRTREPWHALAM